MKALLSQLSVLVLGTGSLYLAACAISFLASPPAPSRGGLDTSRAASTLYMTEPKYVFLNRAHLTAKGPKLILLGASSTVFGFGQDELAHRVAGTTVDNLAVGGANLTEVAQVADVATRMETPPSRRQTTFVIGLWYGMFATDNSKWFTPDRHSGDTDIAIVGTLGSISGEQFEVLGRLVSRLLSQGSSVVVVDLPLPRWHRERSPFMSSYTSQLAALVSRYLGTPGFSFMSLKGLGDDDDFCDAVHPEPRLRNAWSAQLATGIEPNLQSAVALTSAPPAAEEVSL